MKNIPRVNGKYFKCKFLPSSSMKNERKDLHKYFWEFSSRILYLFFLFSQSHLSLSHSRSLSFPRHTTLYKNIKRRRGLPAQAESEREIWKRKNSRSAHDCGNIFSPQITPTTKQIKIAILHFLLPSKCEERRERGLTLNNFCI